MQIWTFSTVSLVVANFSVCQELITMVVVLILRRQMEDTRSRSNTRNNRLLDRRSRGKSPAN